MSDDSRRETLRFDSPTGNAGQIDILRSLIPADWQPVDEADDRVLEGDLGVGMPRLRVEKLDEGWVGTLIVNQSGDQPTTEACDSLNTAALHLRERLFTYGKALKERAEEIIAISQHDG